jgi:3-(3-hydroxy-phenyl)propionate hydroxylase
VLDGKAPISLMDSYDEERAFAADDNLLNSTRSTDFITPKSEVSRTLRDATMELAGDHAFARKLVNSGRLSTPTPYAKSSLNTPDESTFAGQMSPGTNCADAPVSVAGQDTWLLNQLGEGFVLLCFGDKSASAVSVAGIEAKVLQVGTDIVDVQGLIAERYDGQNGTVYLIRPDQHVAARWRNFDGNKVQAAMTRCLALA